MITALLALGGSVAALAYVYAGYPLLLKLLVWLRGVCTVNRAAITPSMTLLISAYNEAAVMRAKLENALALDYPREKLDIVVVSDASTDGTDEIVAEYADRGIRCLRQEWRRGKTAGLNMAVPLLRSDLVVFSDANAMYERDALRMLARNFADPAVGCVTGEARYLAGGPAAADAGERAYWGYEMQIKRLETSLGSMVGGDGAIYAIRRALWQELPESAINDFLNPLQIVAAGWRAVYEPEAVCYEETAGAVGVEYRRRIRIVSRSWRAVFQARGVLNPFRVGLFAWCVVSHKMLRWMSGLFMAVALGAIVALLAKPATSHPLYAAWAIAGAMAIAVGSRAGRRATAIAGYFAAVNAASMVGLAKGSMGHVSAVWSTPRQRDRGTRAALVPIGPLFLVAWAVAAALGTAAIAVDPTHRAAVIVFWGSLALLAYVYIGYPLILALLTRVRTRSVRSRPQEPSVTLFIAANDEGSVIEAKLLNSLAVDYPADRLEIVVASDGSVDETNDIVSRFAPRVRLLPFSPRRGKIACINDGIRLVTSEVVVFSDANAFLEPGAVRALVANFADDQVGAVSGDVALTGERAALGRSEDLYYRYERWVQSAESQIGSTIGVDGALYAIRRELFVPPAADTILDDMAIPLAVVRAGRRVVLEPAARAHEQGSMTAREEFARKSRVIAGAVQFLSRTDSAVPLGSLQVMFSLVSHKALRWLSPVFAMAAFLTALALAPSSRAYAAAALAQAGVLAIGAAGCVPALRRVGIVALAHYWCLVHAAAAVGFLRGLSGRQSVLWRRFVRGGASEPAGAHQ